MKNITISVDDEVARWARVWAAENETSVSRMVGQLLRQRMEQARAYEAARQSFLSRGPQAISGRGRYPGREKLHDRAGLR